MRGEIAVGSYGPLSTYTKISTSPVPVRRGHGGVVKRSEVEGERPISVDAEKQGAKPSTKSNLYGGGEVKRERHKGLYKESSVDREDMEVGDKSVEKTGSEVGGASHQEVGGVLHEVRGDLEVPIRRRENSRLRELLKAIESYDR